MRQRRNDAMRRISGTIQQVFAMFDPPTTAITILTDDAALIVAIAAGDLAVTLCGLRCGTAIDAKIDDTHEAYILIDYALSQPHGV
jgi:hypothetical protein